MSSDAQRAAQKATGQTIKSDFSIDRPLLIQCFCEGGYGFVIFLREDFFCAVQGPAFINDGILCIDDGIVFKFDAAGLQIHAVIQILALGGAVQFAESGAVFFVHHVVQSRRIEAAVMDAHHPVAGGFFLEFKAAVPHGEPAGKGFAAQIHFFLCIEKRESDEGAAVIFSIVNKGAVFHGHILNFVAETDKVAERIDHGAVADGQIAAVIGVIKHVGMGIVADIVEGAVFPEDIVTLSVGTAGTVINAPHIFPVAVTDGDVDRIPDLQGISACPVTGKIQLFKDDVPAVFPEGDKVLQIFGSGFHIFAVLGGPGENGGMIGGAANDELVSVMADTVQIQPGILFCRIGGDVFSREQFQGNGVFLQFILNIFPQSGIPEPGGIGFGTAIAFTGGFGGGIHGNAGSHDAPCKTKDGDNGKIEFFHDESFENYFACQPDEE